MEVIDLECSKYIDEYIELCSLEWGEKKTKAEMQEYIKRRKNKILDGDKYISILGLINENELVGFISLFKTDGDDRTDLSPWYATMYVKEKYRNKGYSKILNNAILKKAKELGYKKVYLKTDLKNYYEKFGARYIENLSSGEKLYCIDLENKIEDEISQIKNAKDVYDFMDKNIQYGWIDIYGKEHLNTMKGFRKIYRTMSIKETLENKIGTCIEQVNLMHYLLNKIDVKNKMFCCRIFEPDDYNNLEEDEHMHCFVLYYENEKVYHIEHPNFEKKGIYEYSSENEAVKTIENYYKKLRGGKASPTKEFFEVPVGISFKDFNKYINHI